MGEKRHAHTVLMVKPEGKRPLGRPRHRLDNIKMDLKLMIIWERGLNSSGSWQRQIELLCIQYWSCGFQSVLLLVAEEPSVSQAGLCRMEFVSYLVILLSHVSKCYCWWLFCVCNVHICSWKADSFTDRQITRLLRNTNIHYPLDPAPESAASNPQTTLLLYQITFNIILLCKRFSSFHQVSQQHYTVLFVLVH